MVSLRISFTLPLFFLLDKRQTIHHIHLQDNQLSSIIPLCLTWRPQSHIILHMVRHLSMIVLLSDPIPQLHLTCYRSMESIVIIYITQTWINIPEPLSILQKQERIPLKTNKTHRRRLECGYQWRQRFWPPPFSLPASTPHFHPQNASPVLHFLLTYTIKKRCINKEKYT